MSEQRRVSFYKLPPVRKALRLANKIILPGNKRLSLYDVGKYLFIELKYLRIQERAAAVTFNFLMAMPPTLLFLFSLVPYLPLQNTEQVILNALKLVTPNVKMYVSIKSVVTDFMHTRRRDILSLGIVMTLFYSSNGMMGLMRTFDQSFSLYNENVTLYKWRGSVRRRWTAIKLTIMMICMCLAMLFVFVLQNKKLSFFMFRFFHNVLSIQLLSFALLVILVFLSMSLIYRYGPSLTHKFKFLSAGAVFATIGSLLGTAVFFFLVNNFINYNKVYGSIGSLIAFMVWVWFNTLIILLGYELNVSILLGKLSKSQQGPITENSTHE